MGASGSLCLSRVPFYKCPRFGGQAEQQVARAAGTEAKNADFRHTFIQLHLADTSLLAKFAASCWPTGAIGLAAEPFSFNRSGQVDKRLSWARRKPDGGFLCLCAGHLFSLICVGSSFTQAQRVGEQTGGSCEINWLTLSQSGIWRRFHLHCHSSSDQLTQKGVCSAGASFSDIRLSNGRLKVDAKGLALASNKQVNGLACLRQRSETARRSRSRRRRNGFPLSCGRLQPQVKANFACANSTLPLLSCST